MVENKRFKMTIITNFVIVFMLMGLFTLTFTYNTKYAFKEDKDKPFYKGNESSNNVSLMFNVYWGTEYLDGILDVLDKYDVKTTFFVGGSWVEKNSDYLIKIIERGHEIGNHGYFHKDMKKLDYDANYNEIELNNRLIEKYAGIKPTLFAPPSGSYSDTTLKVANKLGMTTIMWSKDTIDWRDKDTNLIISRATNNAKGGDLILAHPTKNTLEALPSILKYYSENNLKVVKVSDTIKL